MAVFFVASRYCILIVCRRQIRTCIEIVSILVSKHPGFLTSVYYSFLYHLHKSISGSKPVTMVPFLFHNTPKTFHRTVVDTFSYSRLLFAIPAVSNLAYKFRLVYLYPRSKWNKGVAPGFVANSCIKCAEYLRIIAESSNYIRHYPSAKQIKDVLR